MPLIGLFFPRGPSGFGYNSTAEEVTEGRDLSGKTFVVTGCNAGLGGETIRVLTKRGARVIGTARTVEKAKAACDAVKGDTVPLACELSEPDSVRACAKSLHELGPIDAVICNAGIMALPEREVKHGLEMQFLTNHIGHFLLVTNVLDLLTPDGRVVMLSSAAHTRAYREGVRLDDLAAEKGYSAWGAYGQSKLCNLLFARELAKRVAKGQTAYAVHPGVIATNLARHMNAVARTVFAASSAIVLKSIPQGAATQCYVGTHPDAISGSGEYWADSNRAKSSAHGRDDALAKALWTKSEELAKSLV